MAAGGTLLDLYAVLGLTASASKEEVGRAYRKLALRNHPDKCPSPARIAATERFREIAQAYEVLRDDCRRRCYDESGLYDGHHAAGRTSEYDTFVNTFFGDEALGSDGRSADYTYYSLANYDQLTLKEDDLPNYIHDIVRVGLNYLALVVDDLEDRQVIFLRHQRVDILYVMAAYFKPLTQASFDDGYIIHYYDNPLQAGISPAWSDQNVLGGEKRVSREIRSQRVLTAEQFARRQEFARAAPGVIDHVALEQKYAEAALREPAAGWHEFTAPEEAAPLAAGLGALVVCAGGSGERRGPCHCCMPLLSQWLRPLLTIVQCKIQRAAK